MAKPFFIIVPTPESEVGPNSFVMQVMPHPGGVIHSELVFASVDEAIEVLHQLEVPDVVKDTWAARIRQGEGFQFESSYEKFDKLVLYKKERDSYS